VSVATGRKKELHAMNKLLLGTIVASVAAGAVFLGMNEPANAEPMSAEQQVGYTSDTDTTSLATTIAQFANTMAIVDMCCSCSWDGAVFVCTGCAGKVAGRPCGTGKTHIQVEIPDEGEESELCPLEDPYGYDGTVVSTSGPAWVCLPDESLP
jgi:hypothetical protein